MNSVPKKNVPDKTIILHWIESQTAWAELPWADWVRFRGFGDEQSSLMVGAEAGEHYFLVCMLGRHGDLCNVVPHRYVVSSDARLIHGFDGLEMAEREEFGPAAGSVFAHGRRHRALHRTGRARVCGQSAAVPDGSAAPAGDTGNCRREPWRRLLGFPVRHRHLSAERPRELARYFAATGAGFLPNDASLVPRSATLEP